MPALLTKGVNLSSQFVSVMQQSQNYNDLAQLYSLYNYYDQLISYQKRVSWFRRLELYKGDKLISGIYDLIMNQLTQLFLQPTDKCLQDILQKDAYQWQHDSELQRQQLRGNYYALLKTYLMLHFPQQLDVIFVDQKTLATLQRSAAAQE